MDADVQRSEPHWYILWFVTSGMWLIIFLRNFYQHESIDVFVIIQGLNVILSFCAGIANARRYRKQNDGDTEE